MLEQAVQTQHYVSNVYIRTAHSTAYVESYFVAYHRNRKLQNSDEDIFSGGRYLDRMEKRGREWRIALRICVYDWYRIEPSCSWDQYPFGKSLQYGVRKPEDAVYKLFGDLAAYSTRARAGIPRHGGPRFHTCEPSTRVVGSPARLAVMCGSKSPTPRVSSRSWHDPSMPGCEPTQWTGGADFDGRPFKPLSRRIESPSGSIL